MIKNNRHIAHISLQAIVLGLLFFLNFSAAFGQLTIHLELLVDPVIEEGDIYIATDLNDWHALDPDFKMTRIGPKSYQLILEKAPERFEYKFTQGNWSSAEGTPVGQALPNRVYNKNAQNSSDVYNTILGWEENVLYSIFLSTIPDNTPEDAQLFIVGNFNNWEPGDKKYRLKKAMDGSYRIRINTELEEIEYKFTRGDWKTVEARVTGKARPNRKLKKSDAKLKGDVDCTIQGWEDLHGAFSFYSLYDLLLLFSVFQGILLMIAIPSLQANNSAANKWLLLTIGLSSISILFYILSNFQNVVTIFPKVLFLGDIVLFLYAPFYYFYLRKLLFNIKGLPTRWYVHFIPFLIQMLIYLPYLLRSDKSMLDSIMNQDTIVVVIFLASGFAALIWNGYYWNLFRKTIAIYKEQFQSNFSYDQNLNYLNTVLIIQFICLAIWAFFFVVFGVSRLLGFDTLDIQENFIDLIWLSFSVVTYLLGYFAISQPETFKAVPQSISILDDPLESTVAQKKVTLVEKTVDENLIVVVESLEKNIKLNRPFLNPRLTLSELANQIKTQPHILSKAINEHYGKNFFELINGYRIEEFKRLVDEEKFQNYTLLALAYEVGFNSKTAFNRSFKKSTNQTPKEYFEEAKQNPTMN